MSIGASNFRPHERNTLRGFVDLELPSGLVTREATWQIREGKERIGLPGKPRIDRDGKPRPDQATGKLLYVSILSLASKETRQKFQMDALAAVHRLTAGERP